MSLERLLTCLWQCNTEMELIRISPESLTEDDLKLLYSAIAEDKTGTTSLKELLNDAFKDRIQLWRRGEMIIVSCLNRNTKGLKFFILFIAGSGWFRNKLEIKEELKALAKARGCYAIGGSTSKRGLQRLYESIGAQELTKEYELEI